jgi:hypothetical protein
MDGLLELPYALFCRVFFEYLPAKSLLLLDNALCSREMRVKYMGLIRSLGHNERDISSHNFPDICGTTLIWYAIEAYLLNILV